MGYIFHKPLTTALGHFGKNMQGKRSNFWMLSFLAGSFGGVEGTWSLMVVQE
jgi:hypothetical protein